MAIFSTTKRDELIREFLAAHGIFSIEEAPDELLDEAQAHADTFLGKGVNN